MGKGRKSVYVNYGMGRQVASAEIPVSEDTARGKSMPPYNVLHV